MSSERRRQANRQNAKASTGPRSAAGKARSAQNAKSHGLTVTSSLHAEWSAEVSQLARFLAGPDETDPVRLEAADQAAAAHFDAVRARLAQIEIMQQYVEAATTPPLPRPGNPVAVLSEALGVDLRGLVAALEPGLSPREFDQARAFVKKEAGRVFRIRALRPPSPESWLIKAARLVRYQRRALSRCKRALRLLADRRSQTDQARVAEGPRS